MPLKDPAARKLWAAQYYIRNKNKIKAYARRYSAEHKAERAAYQSTYQRAYYHAHRDQALARHAAHTAAHCGPGSACRSYKSMLQRVLNPNHEKYRWYGARGVTIAKRWLGPNGLQNFEADMGPRPEGKTLDRIRVKGNYTKANCRWATPKQQANNRRPTTQLRKAA